jgi:hypothetical protein
MDQNQLDFLTQQKIELLLQQKTKRLNEEVGELRQVIQNMQKDIFSLRQQVKNGPVGTRADPVISSTEPNPAPPAPTPPPQPTPQPQAAAPKPAGNHPRHGKFNSDDVSIEKFFNFSGK